MAGMFETRTDYDYSGSGGESTPYKDRIVEIAAAFGDRDKYTDRMLRKINRKFDRQVRRAERGGSERQGLRELVDGYMDEFLDKRMYNPEEDYEFQGSPEYIREYGSVLDKLGVWLSGR